MLPQGEVCLCSGTVMSEKLKVGADWRSLAAVIATAAIIGIGSAMLPPLISIRAETSGVSTAWNGLLAAMPSVAILLTGAAFPMLIKRFGPLAAFYASTALAIILILVFPLLDNYWCWLVIRLLMGATLGLQWVISEAWINGLAAGPRHGTILGIYVAVFCVGLAAGPLMLSFFEMTSYLPFVLCAVTYLLCGLPLPLAKPMETLPEHQKPMSFAAVLRAAPMENFASFINGCTWGSALALLPLYAMHLGLQGEQGLRFLSALCIGSLIGQPIIGRLIDKFTERLVLMVCGIVQVICCATLATAVGQGIIAWPLLFAWGAAIGGLYTAGLTGLGKRVAQANLPAASTAFTMVWEAGGLLGPIIVGVAMVGWDPHGLALVFAVLGIAMVIATLLRVPILAVERPRS